MGIVSVLLLVFIGIEFLSEGEVSHQFSYSLPHFFPPRNILALFLVLALTVVVFLSNNVVQKLSWLAIVGIVIVCLQAKAALLSLVLLGVLTLFRYRLFKLTLLVALLAIGTYNIYVYSLFSAKPDQYVGHVANTPDVLKTFNLPYNVSGVESFTERKVIWEWTIKQINLIKGKGIGQWKYDVQGNVYLPKYNCHTIIRRVHNEPLKFLYENGFLGVLLLLVLFVNRNYKALLILLPPLLFSFPLERAGLIIPMFLILEIRNESFFLKKKPVNKTRIVPLIIAVGAILFTSGFHHAEKLYSSFVKEINKIGELGSMEKELLEVKKEDFLLNSFKKYEAIWWISQNKPNEAIESAKQAYEEMPNHYGNYRLTKGIAMGF